MLTLPAVSVHLIKPALLENPAYVNKSSIWIKMLIWFYFTLCLNLCCLNIKKPLTNSFSSFTLKFMMSITHSSQFYMMPWSVFFRLYNKKAMKKFRICHFIQSRDHKWFSIKPDSFLCFSVFSQWQKVKYGMKFCFSTNQRIFHLDKAFKLFHSPSFASLQCSHLISEAPHKWFSSIFLSTFSEKELPSLKKAKSTDGWLKL